MRLLNEAYSVLMDPVRRVAHDREIEAVPVGDDQKSESLRDSDLFQKVRERRSTYERKEHERRKQNNKQVDADQSARELRARRVAARNQLREVVENFVAMHTRGNRVLKWAEWDDCQVVLQEGDRAVVRERRGLLLKKNIFYEFYLDDQGDLHCDRDPPE